MIKVFHIADAHLGERFSYLNSKDGAKRRVEIELSLTSQIKNAYNKGARVFLLAGDMFDSRPYDKDGEICLKNIFDTYSDADFFLIFGNHDYITSDDFVRLSEIFPDNVYMFSGDADMYEFDDYRVYGSSFTDEFQKSSVISDFHITDDEKVNIILIHGMISADTPYNPISITQIENTGADYIALGHVHKYNGVKKAGKTFYAYSGTCEGKGFDECGETGGIYLELSKGNVEYEFIPGANRRHHEVYVDISDAQSLSDIINTTERFISNENDLYKIVLSGEVDLNMNIDCSIIYSQLCDRCFYLKIYDETSLKIDVNSLINQDSLQGTFAREVMLRMDNADDKEHWMDVLKKGISLLNKR